MIKRLFVAFTTLAVLPNCAELQQAGGPNTSNPPPASAGQAAPAGAAPAEGPAFPKTVSVSIKVECRDSVDVFFGKEPKYGSGTASHLGGNSLQNHMFQAGDMIWITDSNQNGIGSATISENTRDVTVTCNGISAR